MDDRLRELAELLRRRDALDARIAGVTGRSARPGDVGEFIAAAVFDIQLAASPTQAGFDGRFRSGALAGVGAHVIGPLSARRPHRRSQALVGSSLVAPAVGAASAWMKSSSEEEVRG